MIFRKLFAVVLIVFCSIIPTLAQSSNVTHFPIKKVYGKGPLPYNYRVIDQTIHAGGHPLNPTNYFRNSDEQVRNILAYLKDQGVITVIDLENTWGIQRRYKFFLKEAGLKRLHVPMHAFKLPNQNEWDKIKAAIAEGPVYIHCKWGADRTGAVIGYYLVEEKGYRPDLAWIAVVTKGTHAGKIGGLKRSIAYNKLKSFIWLGP
jgi:protein tyrosine phosphatase (PTP) superfamily phosphohydrolase (DUF442 family)